jgi:alkylation response protein AidB-like acyl-CoA dehydrogenase
VLAPLNPVGDTEGCRLENGIVYTPTGFKDAFEQMKENGWPAIDMPEEFGGQGLPYLMNTAVGEMFSAANQAFTMYQGLTHGAASAIIAHGTDEQKAKWLPKMVSCDWTGTMNLTEPHCGTDLGLMRTKAEPQDDGTYRVTGQKIFISAGDHDMAENIVHLVLAKIPGGPEGIKGVSLFIVPKFLVNDDGSLGARNGVSCGKIEEKMGIHGNSTCVMNYDGAEGYLLGEAHKGMRAMFTMMNEARLGVGMQGVAQAEVAFQNALDYAKDRLQGRDVTGPKNPDGPADPLIVHPDIRRNLMEQKSFVEGARAFLLWGSTLIDRAHPGTGRGCRWPGLAPDPGHQGLPHRQGLRHDRAGPADLWRARLYRGMGHVAVHPRRPHRDDLRGRERRSGARPRGPQARLGRRQACHGLLRPGEGLRQGACETDGMAEFLEPLKRASKDLQAAGMYFMSEGMKNPNNALAGRPISCTSSGRSASG